MSHPASNVSAASKNNKTPSDYLQGLQENWKTDLSSGFILFLIALPLSVGIAIASGAPPAAGLLAAIVGGMLGALLSGSYVTINGPAAGMIVIVLGAVQAMAAIDPEKAFSRTLAAVAIAGAIQIAMGVLKIGSLGLAFPTSVIHGMMMAIGVIIMSKQIHLLLGVSPHSKSILGLIAEIPESVQKMNPEVATIGIGSLLLVLLINRAKSGWLKKVPAPLVAVVFGLTLGLYFDLEHEHTVHFFSDFTVGPNFLLNIPQNFSAAFTAPDFSLIGLGVFWKMVFTIALVASIESILSTYAVDKLDPYKRISNLDRDLMAKGVCNLVLGMIGGIPIISEIVRSSANVTNGAKTRWSNFFHGTFILIFLAAFPTLLHEIPLASLAAILLTVGYRLGNPKQLGSTWKIGWDQFIVFTTTLVLTLVEDLLVGVAVGLVVEFLVQVIHHPKVSDLFVIRVKKEKSADQTVFRVEGPLVFANFLGLKKMVEHEKLDRHLVIDLESSPYVDHTMMEHLERFEQDFHAEGRHLEMKWSRLHQAVSDHPQASRRLKKSGA